MVLTTSVLRLSAYPLQTLRAQAGELNWIPATSDNELGCVIDIFAGKHHHYDASPAVFTPNEKRLSGIYTLCTIYQHT
jgi:hypothetical protein